MMLAPMYIYCGSLDEPPHLLSTYRRLSIHRKHSLSLHACLRSVCLFLRSIGS